MPTITETLQSIFDDAVIPVLLAAASTAWPPLALILKIPVVGALIQSAIKWATNWLVTAGVIELKIGVLEVISLEAKAKWAKEITIIKAAQSQDSLTPEQEAEYEKALQGIVQNHHGTVNA